MVPRRTQIGVFAVVAALVAAGIGLGVLNTHASTAGPRAASPELWPVTLGPLTGRTGVVLAVHPRCPCSRATAAQLERALDAYAGQARVVVLAYAPESGEGSGWERSGVLDTLRRIKDAHIEMDPGGRRAAALGLQTSGHALLFSPDGRLAYSGGLTPTRGHEGPCTGVAALTALLAGRSAPASRGEVYGCGIQDQSPRPEPSCCDDTDPGLSRGDQP
jgi:hypothetical protein